MSLRRLLVFISSGICLLWVGSAPVAAQSVNRNLIDTLNTQLLYVAFPLTVFVEVILIYAVFRFRNNENPRPTLDAPPLEITWTIATAIILVFVGVSAYVVLSSSFVSPETAPANETNDETIRGLGYQWAWQFTYPEANLTTQGELVMPANRDVRLRITSADVLHSLFIPEFGVKKDAFPGQYTVIRTRVHETGAYRAYCTELCGVGHSLMRANVTVVNQSTYREWLRNHEDERNVTDVPSVDAD